MLLFPKFTSDFGRNLLKFSLGEFQLGFVEVHIGLRVDRNQVNMSVSHFQTEHHLRHFSARESPPNGLCYLFGKYFKLSKFVVFHIEDIVNFTARNNQRVPLCQRIDVKKGIKCAYLLYAN